MRCLPEGLDYCGRLQEKAFMAVQHETLLATQGPVVLSSVVYIKRHQRLLSVVSQGEAAHSGCLTTHRNED